jgi:hypothetical protein
MADHSLKGTILHAGLPSEIPPRDVPQRRHRD